MIVLDYQKQQIHQGNSYFIDRFATLNNTDEVVWGVDTDGVDVHINLSFSSTQRTTVFIYEGETFSGGTQTVAFNNNRNSTNVTSVQTFVNPTSYTITGTNIMAMTFGGGLNPANAYGGEAQRNVMLKRGANYIVVIKSYGDDNHIDYRINWIETT